MRIAINDGWTVKNKVSSFSDLVAAREAGTPVVLPHDAMVSMPRSATAGEGPSTGYFPGGVVEYSRSLQIPHHWDRQRAHLQFDGVYRSAVVFVDGAYAGQRPNGYAPFRIDLAPFLRPGHPVTVRVESRAHQDSRWYSGLGMLRDAWLVVQPPAHIEADGVRVTTPDIDEDLAVVVVTTRLRNDDHSTRELALRTELVDPAGSGAAAEIVPVTLPPGSVRVVQQRLHVRRPHLWSPEAPHLYRARQTLDQGTGTAVGQLDDVITTFGIRRLQLDPLNGLRLNGEVTVLRGACIHHDHGVLGAAAFPRAEERRIKILKSAGFNAIRTGHSMAAPALLDACDRLGMLVIDEAFDMWFEAMKPYDYSLDFVTWWERDVEAMVAKDFNHPSVIMYSIANEVPEAGTPHGGSFARLITEKIRSLDSTRFTTNAVSSFWAVSAEILDDFLSEVSSLNARGVNDVMNGMEEIFARITTSDLVTERTRESQTAVDVIGLNYAHERYADDITRNPQRVLLGTETNPRQTDLIWQEVRRHPQVIGDFTWTGWDYLGEVGLGRTDYVPEGAAGGGAGDPDYPWRYAWCGDIDITGHRRPASYYREIVWGLRTDPYVTVFRPRPYGHKRREMQWAWSDTVSSWSWDLPVGTPVEVEVFSPSDEVLLHVNGHLAGRAPTGPGHRYRALFTIPYEPGTLIATAVSAGSAVGHHTLTTAGPTQLILRPDRRDLLADASDLCFVDLELRDPAGALITHDDRLLSVDLAGPAVLQGLGSARPASTEPFDESQCMTFDGRALAVVRPLGPGTVVVTCSTDGLPEASTVLTAGPAHR